MKNKTLSLSAQSRLSHRNDWKLITLEMDSYSLYDTVATMLRLGVLLSEMSNQGLSLALPSTASLLGGAGSVAQRLWSKSASR